jgi:pyruvate formate lyase activating enzyme
LSTAIETSGYAEWSAFDKALKRTDLVLYDLKHIDSTRHREATGVSNDLILANLKKTLSETAVRVWIRIPIIPNFNDSTGTIERMRGFIQRLPRLPEKVSMLPFHKLGLGKYAALGKVYEYENAPLIDKEEIDEYKRIIESNGIKVDIGF